MNCFCIISSGWSSGVVDIDESCLLTKKVDETTIILKGDVNIYQSKQLKSLLIQSIDCNQPIRVDLSDINELDLTTMQLLLAVKKAAQEKNLSFSCKPISDKAQTILDNCAMSVELFA